MSQLRIVAIGKTGVGKSSFGNTVMNKKVFKSSSRGTSLTRECQLEKLIIAGRSVTLVDSPGFIDTQTKNQDEVMREIKRCMFLSAPGPHAICFVVQIGRFTQEDIDTMNAFVKHFGIALYNHVVVVFTRYDDFQRDCEDNETECNIQNYISTLPPTIKDFVKEKCGSRVIAFDNTLKGEKSQNQVQELFQIIENMVMKNGNQFYSNNDLQRAEAIIKEEMKREKMRIEQERKEEIEKREKDIEKEADKKTATLMMQKMLDYKEDIKKQLEEETLRINSQKSSSAFEIFEKIVSVAAVVIPVVAPIIQDKIDKDKKSKSESDEKANSTNEKNKKDAETETKTMKKNTTGVDDKMKKK